MYCLSPQFGHFFRPSIKNNNSLHFCNPKVDELGRVALPIELRRNLDIKEKDALETFVDKERVVLQNFKPAKLPRKLYDDHLVLASKRQTRTES